MKAAVTDGQGKIFFEDIPEPEIVNDYQCLCRIDAVASCTGTDYKLIKGTLGFGAYPSLFGHESVGTVIACGDKVRNFAVGDTILRPCALYPGDRLGDLNSFAAGYTKYGLVTDRNAWLEDDPNVKLNNYTKFQQRIPGELNLSPADATMFITLKETASAVNLNTDCSIGKKILILGAGSVGLSMARFSRMFGADSVVLAARRRSALDYAKSIRCCNEVVDFTKDWVNLAKQIVPEGFDIILDATGCGDIMIKAGNLLNAEGKLYFYAVSKDRLSVTQALGESRVTTANPIEDQANDFLINSVDAGLIDLKQFYSHVMPLENLSEGFELIGRKNALKVVFTCS